MAEKASRKLVFCQHCGDNVSKRTYYQHRRLYFDTKSQKWSDTRVWHSSTSSEVFDIDVSGRAESLPPDPLGSTDEHEVLNEGNFSRSYI